MGMDPEIQNHYGEPTKGQTRAPVPKFERISLSPQSILVILARYRGLQDHGNSFRHPEPQKDTQEPATEEPTRRQARAPVPNPDRISLSPRSTSVISARYRRFQYHGNGFRHP